MKTDQTPEAFKSPISNRNKTPTTNYQQERSGALDVLQLSSVNTKRAEITNFTRADLASKFLLDQKQGANTNMYESAIAAS